MKHYDIVKKVEEIIGMGHGAWDCVDPQELSKAFLKVFESFRTAANNSEVNNKSLRNGDDERI